MAEVLFSKVKDTIITFFTEKNIDINKIVLFGSFSKGTPNDESDIDLIILSADFENKSIFQKAKTTDGLEWLLIKQTKKPFDILYQSVSEWENSSNMMIREAKQHGIVLYS